jgi:hypothetical protein
VLRHARELCAQFRIPPRQFRRRVRKGEAGYYSPASDIVAVDPDRAAMDGMGGEDGYYAMLMHELLHATGHPSRLNRATSGDYSIFGYDLEEGTVRTALRTVLKSIGFPPGTRVVRARLSRATGRLGGRPTGRRMDPDAANGGDGALRGQLAMAVGRDCCARRPFGLAPLEATSRRED